MNRNKYWYITMVGIFLSILLTGCTQTGEQQPIQAVMFYSPDCGHCIYLKTEYLPELEQDNSRLEIVQVNLALQEGYDLFLSVVEQYGVPPGEAGVPFMIIQDEYYIGSVTIPNTLEALLKDTPADETIPFPDFEPVQKWLEEYN